MRKSQGPEDVKLIFLQHNTFILALCVTTQRELISIPTFPEYTTHHGRDCQY